MRIIYTFFATLIFFSAPAFGQLSTGEEKGLPPQSVFHSGDVDSINLENGNLHISIPLLSVKQRGGGTLTWQFVYDSVELARTYIAANCGSPHCPPGQYTGGVPISAPLNGGVLQGGFATGWRITGPFDWMVDATETDTTCVTTGYGYSTYTNWSITDPQGTKHALGLRQESGSGCEGQTLSGPTLDGSGMTYDITTNIITLKDGSKILPTGNIQDRNGNVVSPTQDTLGRNLVTQTNAANITYTSPNGVTKSEPAYSTFAVNNWIGSPLTYRVDYTLVDFKSNACTEALGAALKCTDQAYAVLMPSKITLPNGQAYAFSYTDNTPAQMSEVDLPTGASIHYTYGSYYTPQAVQHGSYISQIGGPSVTSRTVVVDGASYQWLYSIPQVGETTVTDPLGNQQVHTFQSIPVTVGPNIYDSPGEYETSVVYYGSAGNVLRTVQNDYTAEYDPINVSTANVRKIRTTTTLENNLVSKEETDYETFPYTTYSESGVATRMNPTETRLYDFGNGSPGALLKKTDYTYLHNSNPAYVPLNIVDKAQTVTVYDGSGNMMSQVANEYDNYSHTNQPMQASNAIQHVSGFGISYTTRGNITGISQWRNTDGVSITTTTQYDDAGNVLSTIDPGGHQTTYSYADSWANSACAPTGATAAYPTRVTNAKGQFTTTTYNACTGSIASTTDLNTQTTTYSYDAFDRPHQVVFPMGGGQKIFCYSDDSSGNCYSTSLLYSTETTAIDTSSSIQTTTVYDGLGRVKQTQNNLDPNGTAFVDSTYDGNGRPSATSNPYRSGDTEYWTTTHYDGLARVSSVTKGDGSATSTTYAGNTTTITDEAGNQRKTQSDALGHLNYVWEDPAGLNYETDYLYDVFGNLLKATQKGGDTNSANWRVRTFTYNSLGELLCSANPEIGSPSASVAACPTADSGSYVAGTVRYLYNNDGELISRIAPAPNQTGTSTVTTSYAYDVLHRSTGISYSDTTPAVSYTYDNDPVTGCTPPSPSPTATYLMGHIKAICDASGATAWSYDTVGRTIAEARRIGTASDQIGYSYYLNGAVKTVTYPKSGASTTFLVTYHQNASGRIDTATGSDGVTYAQVNTTWASGAPNTWKLGANVQLADTYNARLQPLAESATQTTTSNTLFSRAYDFHATGSTPKDNGNLYAVQDNLDTLDQSRPHGSVTYTYDTLNRVHSAATAGTDCTGMAGGTKDWATTYTVDAWGNLKAKTPTMCQGESMAAVTTNNRNQLSSATYDSAGNIISELGIGYSYDAEGRMTNGSGTTYTYDGLGERVMKTGKLYWKGSGSTALVETDATNANPTKYIFFNGQRIARLDPASTAAKYYIADNIGSTALVTDSTGNPLNESLFFPYGVERVISQSDTANNYKFTGKERDTETGLDDFGARYYDSTLGRFMTPDWDAKPTSVPYAKFGDPQTLNLYSYVKNSPLNNVDADGHTSGSSGGITAFAPISGDEVWACAVAHNGCDGLTIEAMFPQGGYIEAKTLTLSDESDGTSMFELVADEHKQSAASPQAQQQTGRQPDGSYIAPTGPGSDIYNRTHGGADGQVLHPPDDTKGQCVTACKHFSGITAPTTAWKEGPAASGNSSLPIGTAIATFGSDGKFNQPNGDQNSGIYMGQGSKPGSILILDQWPAYGPPTNTPAHPPSIREMPFNSDYGHSMANSASAYHVIIVP